MNEEFKPSPVFVARVMDRVHDYEASRRTFVEWLISHPALRYALAGGGTLFGVFKALPVF